MIKKKFHTSWLHFVKVCPFSLIIMYLSCIKLCNMRRCECLTDKNFVGYVGSRWLNPHLQTHFYRKMRWVVPYPPSTLQKQMVPHPLFFFHKNWGWWLPLHPLPPPFSFHKSMSWVVTPPPTPQKNKTLHNFLSFSSLCTNTLFVCIRQMS